MIHLITMMSAKLLNNSLRRVNNLIIQETVTKVTSRTYSKSVVRTAKAQIPTMQQVEVDEAGVKEKLGDIQMAFVKKAEGRNAKRASMHRYYRKKDAFTGLTCMAVAGSIYAYTIIAMEQEDFLDDFEMPDPMDGYEEDEEK